MRILFLILALASPAVWAQTPESAPPADFSWTSDGGPPAAMMTLQSADIRFEGEPVKDSPYSAEAVTETTQSLPDGNRIRRENRTKIYRDSAGRTRREETLQGIGPWSTARSPKTIVFIHDPVEGTHYVLHPEDKTARKMPTPNLHDHISELVHEDREPEKRVERVEKKFVQGDRTIHVAKAVRVERKMFEPGDKQELESRLIEGVEATGTRTTLTIEAGAIGNERAINVVSERWFSPELGVEVLTTRDDPRIGKTTYRLTNIQRGEQPLTLFVPPGDYTIEEGDPFANRVGVIGGRVSGSIAGGVSGALIQKIELDRELEIEQEHHRDR